MAVISEVKCGRCDRRYSGFRSRCPYCGARRNKRGKHADEADNAKAKLVIGILLLILLIAATMVLILTSLHHNSDASNPSDSVPAATDSEPVYTDNENVTSEVDTSEPEPTESASPSPSPAEITEVIITYNKNPIKENDFTLGKVGTSLPLGFKTTPETTDKTATWASSDESIFMVTSDGTVTAVGKGSATVTCTVDGVVGKCTVRVSGK